MLLKRKLIFSKNGRLENRTHFDKNVYLILNSVALVVLEIELTLDPKDVD